ncbi:MAG: hypothetical protein AAF682_19800 [Planctomycetota bacterium]
MRDPTQSASTSAVSPAAALLLAGVLAGLFVGCAKPPPHTPPEGRGPAPLQVSVQGSFREMGVRKSMLLIVAESLPLRLLEVQASREIELPDFSLPMTIRPGTTYLVEIAWRGEQPPSGTIRFRTDAADDEVVVDVAYG